MNRKQRLKILDKIAQTTGTPTISGNTTVVAPPPALDVWAAYPEPMKAYSQIQKTIINSLVQRLSNAVNQLTNGKYNFQKLRDVNFKFDPSSFSDTNTKNIMIFFGKVFKTLLNNGVMFNTQPINPQQLGGIIASLTNAPELSQMSQTNPTGPVANQAPGNANLAQTIRNILQSLQPSTVNRPV